MGEFPLKKPLGLKKFRQYETVLEYQFDVSSEHRDHGAVLEASR